MSESKPNWTPGPWRVVMEEPHRIWPKGVVTDARGYWDNYGSTVIDEHIGRLVCSWHGERDGLQHSYGCEGPTYATHHEHAANARLIAAAPELYEALEQAREVLAGVRQADVMLACEDAGVSAADIFGRVDAVLRKARGEQ